MRIWASLGTYYSIYYNILPYHQILFTCTWSVFVSITGNFYFCYSFVGVLWGFLNHYNLLLLIFPFLEKLSIFHVKVWFLLHVDDSKMYIFSPIFLSPPPPVFSHQPIPLSSNFYWVISLVNSLALPNLPYLVPGHQFHNCGSFDCGII